MKYIINLSFADIMYNYTSIIAFILAITLVLSLFTFLICKLFSLRRDLKYTSEKQNGKLDGFITNKLKDLNVTYMQEVESLEVKSAINKLKIERVIVNLVLIITLILLIVVIILYLNNPTSNIEIFEILLVLASINLFSIPIYNIIFYYKLKPYYQIYKIAYHNDLIRHDELLRIKERQRMSNPKTPPQRPTKETIERTLHHLENPNDII